MPDPLLARAAALAADSTVALGATESYPLPGVTTLIRVEPHTWSRDASNNLIEGCFRAGGVYLPGGTAQQQVVVPPMDNLTKGVAILTGVSLVVGTVATLAAWGKK
jgi:hypothetical protein